MSDKNARRGCLNALMLLTGCGVALSATGCFLLPMPRDDAEQAEFAAPVEASLPDDSIDVLDPIVEEPIRELGDDEPIDEPIEEIVEQESGDLNDDGLIDESDVEVFRTQFGNFSDQEENSPADLDGDGSVTLVDFQIFLTLAPGGGRE